MDPMGDYGYTKRSCDDKKVRSKVFTSYNTFISSRPSGFDSFYLTHPPMHKIGSIKQKSISYLHQVIWAKEDKYNL